MKIQSDFIKNQSTHFAESSSSPTVGNNNNKRFCDTCIIWIFESNTFHDNTKTYKQSHRKKMK